MTVYVVPQQTINVSSASNSSNIILSTNIAAANINVSLTNANYTYNIASTVNSNISVAEANVTVQLNSNVYTFNVVSTSGNNYQISVPAYGTVISTPNTNVALSIAVSNGTLVNGAGAIVQLRGADQSGMEGSYALGANSAWAYGGWSSSGTGVQPPFANLASQYKWNAYRIPLHCHSVLGFTSYKIEAGLTLQSNGSYNLPTSLTGLTTVNMDPHGTYLSDLDAAIAASTAANCYTIIDLHLWAPDVVINGTTVHLWNASQDPSKHMPDENALAAWTVLANRYKNNPAVIFDLVNEPTYPTWNEWLNGTTRTFFDYNTSSGTYYGQVNSSWTQVGMKALLNAVRATGATNVCMMGGVGYSGELGYSGWITGDSTGATWLSTVTGNITDSQICTSIHVYPSTENTPSSANTAGSFVVGRAYQIVSSGTTNFTAIGASSNSSGTQFTATGVGSGTGTAQALSSWGDPNYYRYAGADNTPSSNGYSQWVPLVQSIMAAGYPVVMGETGGQSSGSGTEPFVSNVLSEVDALNTTKPGSMHCLAWAAEPGWGPGGNFNLLYYTSGSTYAPTTDEGHVFCTWTTNHSSP